MMLNEIELNRLRETVGVLPCLEWMEALHEQDVVMSNSADEVLHAILHCDLKEVVGDISGNSNDNNAVLLRNAIEKSMLLPTPSQTGAGAETVSTTTTTTAISNNKPILPSTFCHMIQVEEILDVSVNAQERLELGPADECSNNNRKRCLKLLCSDGLSPSIVAMETCPIPDISVNSLPGIKLLIRGSVQVRYGVLLLNDGNTLVLGGCIPSLIPIRQKAIEAARKQAGIGIDPTIKALIWNNNQQQLLIQEQDEEGYDDEEVIPRNEENIPIDATIIPNNTVVQQRPQAAAETNRATTRSAITTVVSSADTTNTSTNNTPYNQSTSSMPMVSTSISSTISNYNNSSTRNNGCNKMIVNPYRRLSSDAATSGVITASHNSSTATTAIAREESVSSTNTITNMMNNFHASIGQDNNNTNDKRPTANDTVDLIDIMDNPNNDPNNEVLEEEEMDMTPTFSYRIDDNDVATSVPNVIHSSDASIPLPVTLLASVDANISSNNINENTATVASKSSPASIIRATIIPTPSMVEPVSFAELFSIYTEISSSQLLYEQYYQNNTVFVVPSKLRFGKENSTDQFSLRKIKQQQLHDKKKKNKKGGDKYEYVGICTLVGTNEADGSIPCKIDSILMEPFFGMAPGKMRELSRIDFDEAQTLCNTAGSNIIADYSHLASFRLKLLPAPQELFSPSPIATDPVFLVIGRDT